MKNKILLCLGSFAFAFVMAEIGLRLFFWGWITQIYVLDDVCLFRPKPSSAHYFQYVPPNEGPRITVAVNSLGYRGPERPFADGERRVLVFGDSFVMAEFSSYENSYCAQLEQRLEHVAGGPVHVVNAGTAGGGPDQYIPRLAAEIPKVDPDLVVVAIYAGNDFGDLVRDKMFRLADDGSLIPVDYTFSQKVRDQFSAGDGLALYRLVRRIRIGQRLDRGWQSMHTEEPDEMRAVAFGMIEADLRLCRSEYEEFVTKGRNDIRALLEDHYDSDLAVLPDSDSARYKHGLMKGVLARIVETVRAANKPMLFVVIPAPVDVCDDYAGGIVDRTKYPDYVPAGLTDKVSSIVRALDVPLLDLFSAFDEGGDALYFLAPDVHWNDAGQALAADLTRDSIVDLGVLGEN